MPGARWWLQHPRRINAGVITAAQLQAAESIDQLLEQMEREAQAAMPAKEP